MNGTVSISELAKMMDYSLLQQTLTDEQLKAGCELARKCDVASVCVKPYHVKLAKECLKGSSVRTGAVVGFPHGNSAVEIKVLEAEQALRDGAVELDMVVNLGKVVQEDWDYVEKELKAVAGAAKKGGALLKVIFENDLLPGDKHKIRLCEICGRAGADFVKTATGYNYVKAADGHFIAGGANEHDLKLMRKHSPPHVQVKAAGGVRTLESFLRVREIGVTRIGVSQAVAILDEARKYADKNGVLRLPVDFGKSAVPRKSSEY